MFNPPPFGEALIHKNMEEMREISNKTIIAKAEINAEQYDHVPQGGTRGVHRRRKVGSSTASSRNEGNRGGLLIW